MLSFTDYQHETLKPLAQLWHVSWLSSDPAVFPDDTPERLETLIKENLADDWGVTLAWNNNKLIGFSAIKRQESWLDQLFILPAYQGMGVGLALLDRVKRAMPAGFTLRAAKSNVRAHSFYRRNGFRKVGEVVSPYRGAKSIVYAWP